MLSPSLLRGGSRGGRAGGNELGAAPSPMGGRGWGAECPRALASPGMKQGDQGCPRVGGTSGSHRRHPWCREHVLTAAPLSAPAMPARGGDPGLLSSPGSSSSALSGELRGHSWALALLGRCARAWHAGCCPSGATNTSVPPPRRAQGRPGELVGPSSPWSPWHHMARSAGTELWDQYRLVLAARLPPSALRLAP